jgi:hypothetical protein
VIVDDLDICRASIRPLEYDPPLVIDSDRMLACQVTFKRLQPVSWRHRQIVQNGSIVYLNQLPRRATFASDWGKPLGVCRSARIASANLPLKLRIMVATYHNVIRKIKDGHF